MRNTTIDELGTNKARELTGLSVAQLKSLFTHCWIPSELIYHRRHQFDGEEAFLHYMFWNRCGGTKLRMSQDVFGGDPQ